MVSILNKNRCCACSACEQICPQNAISMERDALGFSYPKVKTDLCINCGLCDNVCPIKKENETRIPSKVYALKNKDLNKRKESSSGGVFSCLAYDVIKNGGIVYGAAFDKDWNVNHTRVDSVEDIDQLRGSKYVQSKLNDTFKQVKKDLKANRKVLFSGCPCQVAGLKSFLKKNYSNLTTVDVVCHGVPNPRIWEEYLKEEKDFEKSSIEKINFRDKSTGWKEYSFALTLKKNDSGQIYEKKIKAWSHTYMQLFLHDFITRQSCHSCHFRNGKSGADMTLCDFWAVEQIHKEFFDDNGVSALLSYNSKIPQCLEEQCAIISTTYNDVCYGNPAIKKDWPKNKESRIFYILHDFCGFKLYTSLKISLFIMNKRVSFRKFKGFIKKVIKEFL